MHSQLTRYCLTSSGSDVSWGKITPASSRRGWNSAIACCFVNDYKGSYDVGQ